MASSWVGRQGDVEDTLEVETLSPCENWHTNLHSSCIHHRQSLETTKMPFYEEIIVALLMEYYSAVKSHTLSSHGKTQRPFNTPAK